MKRRRRSSSIAALAFFVCLAAVSSATADVAGRVVGWGSDGSGNLGNGEGEPGADACGGVCYSKPTPIPVGNDIVAISTAEDQTTALKRDRRVLSWGEERDALGRPTPADDEGEQPGLIPGLSGVKAISTGGSHALALLRNGTVRAFGSNFFGALGTGNRTSSRSPVAVKNLKNIVAIAAGGSHSLALDSSGQVWAWGSDESGELGDGPDNRDCDAGAFVVRCSLVPLKVRGLTTAATIDAGRDFSLALRKDGRIVSWGSDFFGQLGDGGADAPICSSNQPCRQAPVAVVGLSGIVAVSAGDRHALAITKAGVVWAFGSDESGQIGDGNRPASECGVPSFTFPCQKVPVQVPGIGNAIGIDAGRGSNVSFAILADYTLRGWGEDDTSGQLGNGLPLKNVSAPVVIKGVSNVVQVSGGADDGPGASH